MTKRKEFALRTPFHIVYLNCFFFSKNIKTKA